MIQIIKCLRGPFLLILYAIGLSFYGRAIGLIVKLLTGCLVIFISGIITKRDLSLFFKRGGSDDSQ